MIILILKVRDGRRASAASPDAEREAARATRSQAAGRTPPGSARFASRWRVGNFSYSLSASASSSIGAKSPLSIVVPTAVRYGIAFAVVKFRRGQKERAVREMGSMCDVCGRGGPAAVFEFHHVDASSKKFGISDGTPRSWPRVLAELAKCVMLCANCHREVHAGVRTLDHPQPGLAEPALPYAA